MSLLQHCYDLSDPQCEGQVSDQFSWRRFVGLGLQDAAPEDSVLVRLRQRMVEHGLQAQLLHLVNRQIEAHGLTLKRVTLVDATLMQTARRAPAKDDPQSMDGAHTPIRQATRTAANVHDSRRFEPVVRWDEQLVVADKAYASAERIEWLAGWDILCPATRGHPLGEPGERMNRFLSELRSGIEKIFSHWERSLGYRRMRYVGRERNRLELEFKCVVWNLKRWVSVNAA